MYVHLKTGYNTDRRHQPEVDEDVRAKYEAFLRRLLCPGEGLSARLGVRFAADDNGR